MGVNREGAVAVTLGLAVVLQGVGLVVMGGLGFRGALQVLMVSLALATAVASTWRIRMRLNHRVDMLLVMAALGGLGMLVGTWIDRSTGSASAHVAMGHGGHQHGGSPWSMVPTWMTALMLVAAIPAGIALTRCAALARTGWRRWVSTHIVGNGLMVVGMVWVGHWLGTALGRLTGSGVVGHHAAMVLGMLLGMEVGMFAGEASLGLKPWREWTWRADWEATLAGSQLSGGDARAAPNTEN